MKIVSFVFAALSIGLFLVMIIVVSYQWGYMQSAIDYRVAAFSAPANLSVISGLPYLIGSVVSMIIAVIVRRKINN